MRLPTSPLTIVYDWRVAPLIAVHVLSDESSPPEGVQRSHWYLYVRPGLGLVREPFDVSTVRPTSATPVIVGSAVLTGPALPRAPAATASTRGTRETAERAVRRRRDPARGGGMTATGAWGV